MQKIKRCINLDPSIDKRLRDLAVAGDKTISDTARDAIEAGLDAQNMQKQINMQIKKLIDKGGLQNE